MKQVPERYRDHYQQVMIDSSRVVMTSVGPRRDLVVTMWRCRRCLEYIKPNSLGAQSHLAKHVRTLTRAGIKVKR